MILMLFVVCCFAFSLVMLSLTNMQMRRSYNKSLKHHDEMQERWANIDRLRVEAINKQTELIGYLKVEIQFGRDALARVLRGEPAIPLDGEWTPHPMPKEGDPFTSNIPGFESGTIGTVLTGEKNVDG